MTTPIPMDDLRPDLWVTIRDDITDAEFPAFGVELDARELWRRLRSRTPVKPGTPMRVIAVDLPFIYVVVLKADGQEDGPLILDLRRFPVVKISTSVPEAILEFADMKLRSNYEHSLATAATEAAVEAKAEIVKCSLLADAMNGEGVESAEGAEGEALKVEARRSEKAGSRTKAPVPVPAKTKAKAKAKAPIRPPQTATQNQKTHPRTTKTATKANQPTKTPSTIGSAVTKTERRRRGEWVVSSRLRTNGLLAKTSRNGIFKFPDDAHWLASGVRAIPSGAEVDVG